MIMYPFKVLYEQEESFKLLSEKNYVRANFANWQKNISYSNEREKKYVQLTNLKSSNVSRKRLRIDLRTGPIFRLALRA